MRRDFAKLVYEEMKVNQDIYVITGDLGYGLWDKVKEDFPSRFYNVGSSEMAMMGMGVGLAMDGKIPYIYSITPFVLYRPFEMIRNYLDHEKIPVNLIGGGRDKDYGYLGFTHWAEEDMSILFSQYFVVVMQTPTFTVLLCTRGGLLPLCSDDSQLA